MKLRVDIKCDCSLKLIAGSASLVFYKNKFAQSNLGRGPRRGAVAHIRRKVVTMVTMARPKFASKSTPPRGPIAKPHYLPHPWTRPTYGAKRHPDPIRRFATMHYTDRPTDGPTDRPRESLTTIGRCARRATRPKILLPYRTTVYYAVFLASLSGGSGVMFSYVIAINYIDET